MVNGPLSQFTEKYIFESACVLHTSNMFSQYQVRYSKNLFHTASDTSVCPRLSAELSVQYRMSFLLYNARLLGIDTEANFFLKQ